CPICGPQRRTTRNQRREVLRIWIVTQTFLTFRCARCGAAGHARDDGAPAPDRATLAKARVEAEKFAAATTEAKQRRARWLWRQRREITGTVAEVYLRQVRRYGGPIPATLGFLPACDGHSACLIAAFGMAVETEPGVISIALDAVRAVHLTRLAPDGFGKAG